VSGFVGKQDTLYSVARTRLDIQDVDEEKQERYRERDKEKARS